MLAAWTATGLQGTKACALPLPKESLPGRAGVDELWGMRFFAWDCGGQGSPVPASAPPRPILRLPEWHPEFQ